jgi:hypothetical protein
MKAYQIKRLLVLAVVAGLPIACGTSSPTGADIVGVGSESTVSALGRTPATPAPPVYVPPPSDPAPYPNPAGGCQAETMEIGVQANFGYPVPVTIEAIMMDKEGLAIVDESCNKVLWEVVSGTPGDARFPDIEFPDTFNSRVVTVSGPSYGTFRVTATAPNGAFASIEIVLQ